MPQVLAHDDQSSQPLANHAKRKTSRHVLNEHLQTREPVLTFGKPSWFDQVGREVEQAHRCAAVFDQSAFGTIRGTGPDAESFLNQVCADNMSQAPGRAVYTVLLNERGGIESDVIALRLEDEDYRLHVGTAAIRHSLAWLNRRLGASEAVAPVDETEAYVVLALAGPEAARVAASVSAGELNGFGYFQHAGIRIGGVAVRGVRLSYVGEPGWEITCPADQASAVYEALHGAGARPSGTLAQTSMRIEKRFLAYGHNLDTGVTPLEAGLGFAIRWDKEFIGRSALQHLMERPSRQRIVTIVLDDLDAVPLGNEPVHLGNQIIGKTTSAAFGYRIQKPAALSMIDSAQLATASEPQVEIGIAGDRFRGAVSFEAAFDPRGMRMRPRPQSIG